MGNKKTEALDDWSKYNFKQQVKFTNNGYNDYKIGQEFRVNKNSVAGYVLEKIDNKKTGEFTYVIANSSLQKCIAK